MIPRIALRNILRQRRRSVLTLLTMTAGYALCSVSLGLAEGTYAEIIDTFTRDRTGHIQVHRAGYLDRPRLHATIDDPSGVQAVLSGVTGIEASVPRVYGAALAAVNSKTSGAEIRAIDPAREASATHLDRKVSSGRYLPDRAGGLALLGSGLARSLKASLGDSVALVSQGADGSIANDLFVVAGIVGDRDDLRERASVYLHIADAQRFFALSGRTHEIAIFLADHTRARETAGQINAALPDSALEAAPWQVVESAFYDAMLADKRGNWIMLVIIMVIVAIGVLNTVLMTVLERTREFGVLKALGTRPRAIFTMIVIEAACLAIIGIVVGIALGTAGNTWLSTHGIPFEPIDYGGMRFDRMVSTITPMVLWLPAAVTFVTAVVVSVFPALRAARIVPVKAIRST